MYWQLDKYGDLTFERETNEGQIIIQKVRQQLATQKGEWFADLDAGVDWFSIQTGQYNRSRINEILTMEANKVVGATVENIRVEVLADNTLNIEVVINDN